MSQIKNILPIVIFGACFLVVILYLQPPQSLTGAKLSQVALFFTPLLLLLVALTNLYFKFLPKSLVVSFGLILLLVLKSLDALNLVSVAITVMATILIAKSLKKPHPKKRSQSQKNGPLTSPAKKFPKAPQIRRLRSTL